MHEPVARTIAGGGHFNSAAIENGDRPATLADPTGNGVVKLNKSKKHRALVRSPKA
jgi:hypothetical protein